ALVGSIASGFHQPEFIGVGLPVGVIAGVGLYLLVATTFLKGEVTPPANRWYQLLLIALISAIIAHFVEIHFGIAIAATRTYFWTYAGLLIVIGNVLTGRSKPSEAVESAVEAAEARRSRRKRRRRRPKSAISFQGATQAKTPAWLGSAVVFGLVIGFLLVVLVYDFVTNQARETVISDVIWHSLTSKLVKNQWVTTFGVLSMFVLVWWLGGGLAIAEMAKAGMFKGEGGGTWVKALLAYLPFPPVIALLYARWHVSVLRQPVLRQGTLDVIQAADLAASILVWFYVVAFLLLLLVGLALYWRDRAPGLSRSWRGTALLLHFLILIAATIIIWLTNVNVIRADMIFKQGQSLEQSRLWPAAAEVYKHTTEVAPREDFYRLALGRAYLEMAKDPKLEPAQKLAILEETRKELERARVLNPLNTDHSANLARLYHSWAGLSTSPEEQMARINQSLQHYEQATTLSPNTAHLFHEWGLVYMGMGQFDEAVDKFRHALMLDPKFAKPYFSIGDVYYNTKQLEQAAEMYQKGLVLDPKVTQAWSFLGVIYAQLGRHDDAISATLEVLEQRPRDFDALKNLALLYRDTGQLDQALTYARAAANARPDSAPIHQLLGELYRAVKDLSGAEAAYRTALELNPGDVNNLWNMAMIYQDQGRLEEALAQLEAARQLAPDSVQVQQALGDLYLRTADWPQAIEAYEGVLATMPDRVQVRGALAHAYGQVGRLEDAVAQTLKVLEVAPEDYISHKNLALLYQQLGRIDEALAMAEKALELAPENEREAISNLISQLRQAQEP
ncbi:MAG: tetratricopeptide repeat protein, partial [Anaerolineae bacterium]